MRNVLYKIVLSLLIIWAYPSKAQTYTLDVGESAYLYLPDFNGLAVHSWAQWACASSSIKFLSADEFSAKIEVVEPFAGTVIVEAAYVGEYEYNGRIYATEVFYKEFKIKCSAQLVSSISIPESITINVHEEYKFSPKFSPSNAVTDFFWSQGDGDTGVVSLDWRTGTIKGKNAGTVEIILTEMYTLKNTSCQVTVVDPDVPTDPPAKISDRALNTTLDKIKDLIDKTKSHLKE